MSSDRASYRLKARALPSKEELSPEGVKGLLGAALETLIAEAGWTCVEYVVVKDDRASIAGTLAHAVKVAVGGSH